MELHHVVNVDVRSTDTQLLDDVAAALPTDDHPAVGPEYDGPNRFSADDYPSLSDGEERLTARVSFVAGTVDVDGTTYDGAEGASTRYMALADVGVSGAAAYTLRHYKSPVGGVTTEEVREWYETHPDAQPVDDQGESYVPSSWDPKHHIADKISG